MPLLPHMTAEEAYAHLAKHGEPPSGFIPWSCDVCGVAGLKSNGPEGYCYRHRPRLHRRPRVRIVYAVQDASEPFQMSEETSGRDIGMAKAYAQDLANKYPGTTWHVTQVTLRTIDSVTGPQ